MIGVRVSVSPYFHAREFVAYWIGGTPALPRKFRGRFFVRIRVPNDLLMRATDGRYFEQSIQNYVHWKYDHELEYALRNVRSERGPSRIARKRAVRARLAIYGNPQAH